MDPATNSLLFVTSLLFSLDIHSNINPNRLHLYTSLFAKDRRKKNMKILFMTQGYVVPLTQV